MMNLFKLNPFHFLFSPIWLVLMPLFMLSCESEVNDSEASSDSIENDEGDSLLFYWDSEFDKEEKSKIIDWVTQVFEATEETLGDYPFDVYVHIERANNSNTPVSFGLASRKEGKNQVRLFVDPSYSLEELLADWTAPHEFSHLSIPFLGKKNKWFSEGFATYLSRKTLITMDYLSDDEFDSLYVSKIRASKKYFNSTTKTFVEVADSLVNNHIYSSLYWGGSSYFLLLDRELKANGKMPFVDIIKEYQSCCRFNDDTILEVLNSFDSIIGDSICQNLMSKYRNSFSIEIMNAF